VKAEFWHERWHRNEIGFHEHATNRLLLAHCDVLSLTPRRRVFVPLCGKSLDVGWIHSHGCEVTGVELSPIAVTQLFDNLGVKPEVSIQGQLTLYQHQNLRIFQGDFFALSSAHLGAIDVIYDRAALIALPPEMRTAYAKHLMQLTGCAPQLLICIELDSTENYSGPPFPVDEAEINRLYAGHYDILSRERRRIEGGLKGKWPATETVWALNPLGAVTKAT
jgi:thiopurine S-methyltransferase